MYCTLAVHSTAHCAQFMALHIVHSMPVLPQPPGYCTTNVHIELHYTTLNIIALHYTALHRSYNKLHCIALHYTTVHYIALH